MLRRQFLQLSAVSGLAMWAARLPVSADSVGAGGTGPYGPIGAPDANGVRLPAGFTSRVVATTGEPVAGTGYVWHRAPDGGAVFATDDGGWIYVSNAELGYPNGGASAVRFAADGTIVDARSILSGSARNCAGGATPWGTWLSCEEQAKGQVWECDPYGQPAVVRPALGRFQHEAAAVDPDRGVIYLTEDERDGLLYRFVPDTWTDLSSGRLETLADTGAGLTWAAVPDASAASANTRAQVPNAVRFRGGEGAWYADGTLYFTTKYDGRVWTLDCADLTLTVRYDPKTSDDRALTGVDNVTVSATGDVYVCEDGGNMEIVLLSPEGDVEPFFQVDVGGSELAGAAFDPSGTRLYVSSQRNPGRTYEVTGPFRQPAPPPDVDRCGD